MQVLQQLTCLERRRFPSGCSSERPSPRVLEHLRLTWDMGQLWEHNPGFSKTEIRASHRAVIMGKVTPIRCTAKNYICKPLMALYWTILNFSLPEVTIKHITCVYIYICILCTYIYIYDVYRPLSHHEANPKLNQNPHTPCVSESPKQRPVAVSREIKKPTIRVLPYFSTRAIGHRPFPSACARFQRASVPERG